MIPGMSQALKNVDINDDHMKRVEAIVFSMTPEERSNPMLMTTNTARRRRVAAGSGNNIDAVNNFIKQFESMRQMLKQMSKMGGAMGGKMPTMPSAKGNMLGKR